MKYVRGGLIVAATTALLVAVLAGMCAAQTQEDCIQATAKIRADDGSTGTGTLYGFGDHNGKRVALFATAAHVAETQFATAWVGRAQTKVRGVVVWKRSDVDGAVIAVRIGWFGRHPPRPIPLRRARVRLRVGQPIFSIGHPGGGPALLWKGAIRSYDGDGSIIFHPGPEMGRSGSALFAMENGKASIIGIITQRNEQVLTSNTVGRATPITHLQSRAWKRTSAGWFDVQCQGGQCQPPGLGGSSGRRYYSPYREGVDRRLENLERSPGTAPLPPPPQVMPQEPPVDLTPLNMKIAELEGRVNAQGEAIKKIDERQDRFVAVADDVKSKIEDKLPELAKAYEDAKAAALAAKEEAKGAAALAGGAKGAVEAVKADTETVKGAVEKVKADLDEDAPNGLVARLKARLAETIVGRLKEKAVAAGLPAWLVPTTAGIGVVAGGLIVFLLLRAGGARAAAGEPTRFQELAARTPWSWDDKAADIEARVLKRVHNRLHPAEPDEDEPEYYVRKGSKFVRA